MPLSQATFALDCRHAKETPPVAGTRTAKADTAQAETRKGANTTSPHPQASGELAGVHSRFKDSTDQQSGRKNASAVGHHAKDLFRKSKPIWRATDGLHHVGQRNSPTPWPQSNAVILPPIHPTAGPGDEVSIQKNARKENVGLAFDFLADESLLSLKTILTNVKGQYSEKTMQSDRVCCCAVRISTKI